jgi:DNA-binding transcriptional regulator YiaG
MYGKVGGRFAVSGFEGSLPTQTSRSEVMTMPQIIREYDTTTLVGLRSIVRDAAVYDDTDDTVEVPNLDDLMATAAVTRALMPIRLRGAEMKAMRKIMGFTLAELASKLDEKTAVETVSRWESGQPMGGYAEKLFRLLVCETLKHRAPGIAYDGSMIAHLKVVDPWLSDPEYEVPTLEFSLIRVRESGVMRDAWSAPREAA